MNSEELPADELRVARIVIVDDHELVRAGLRNMLADQTDLEVVSEAASGTEAISLCRQLHPDLVLMDVRMPEMGGLEATRVIKQDLPGISVIILTIHENPDYLLEAIKAGAAGYVLKEASQDELLSAVRKVLGGEPLLSPELATRLLQQLASGDDTLSGSLLTSSRRSPGLPLYESLTPRETEVLRLLAQGHTNRQIAQQLMIGAGTAKAHVHSIIGKLGASDRTQAAVQAILLGLIGVDW